MRANFTIKDDLNGLTDEQKLQYYNDVCEHFGIPPELQLLRFNLFDSGDGARKLVLYATKGFTDTMRERYSITTVSLEKTIEDGFVMFKAVGKDFKDRVEMAVGAAPVTGLSGNKLANNVMIAQTRAIRRMTLQFVGAGVLDESEVSGISVDINSSKIPLAQLAVEPMVNPGKTNVGTTEKAKTMIDHLPEIQKVLATTTSFTSEMKQTNFNFGKMEFSNGDVLPVCSELPLSEDLAQPKRRGRPPGPRKAVVPASEITDNCTETE